MAKLTTFALALSAALAASSLQAQPGPERQDELMHLLRHDCGSCHGMTLKGGLGPALTADALAGKPRELLLNTVREGRAGTPMPPWKMLLSAEDIEWLVDALLEAPQP